MEYNITNWSVDGYKRVANQLAKYFMSKLDMRDVHIDWVVIKVHCFNTINVCDPVVFFEVFIKHPEYSFVAQRWIEKHMLLIEQYFPAYVNYCINGKRREVLIASDYITSNPYTCMIKYHYGESQYKLELGK